MNMTAAIRRVARRIILRLKPLIPPASYSVITHAFSSMTSGPIVMAPSFKRVVAFAPHPDDETLGCGGTLALLAARGTEVYVVLATNGEAGWGGHISALELGERRRSEAREACTALCVKAPMFLDYKDGSLWEALPELTLELDRIITEIQPEAIFIPWLHDGHPDHEALSAAAGPAVASHPVEVWCYEVWTALPCNYLVDVSQQWDMKQEALRAHKSAGTIFDMSAHLALSRWRSIHGLSGKGHAEAFMVIDSSTFSELARRAE